MGINESFAAVLKLLSKNNLLTDEVKAVIMKNCAWCMDSLEELLQRLDNQQKLTDSNISKMFSSSLNTASNPALNYMRIYNVIRLFDENCESILYVLTKFDDLKQVKQVADLFEASDGGEGLFPADDFLYCRRPWLNSETFKLIVDHLDISREVMDVFFSKCIDEKIYENQNEPIVFANMFRDMMNDKVNPKPESKLFLYSIAQRIHQTLWKDPQQDLIDMRRDLEHLRKP